MQLASLEGTAKPTLLHAKRSGCCGQYMSSAQWDSQESWARTCCKCQAQPVPAKGCCQKRPHCGPNVPVPAETVVERQTNHVALYFQDYSLLHRTQHACTAIKLANGILT